MKGPSVVIIGSGPSGFYTAESITKKLNSNIDIIDRLPTPFGLIRGGVAPDHQTTKRISLAYSKTAKKEQINFFGNIEIGKDISIDELREIYDVVVLAIGSEIDNKLEIKGNNLKGVYGSAEIVGWYNGHPDYLNCTFDLSKEIAVIIGQGNVAVDVTRVLSKTVDELKHTDIAQHALDALSESKVREVHMIGRRSPVQAAFTNKEIRELGELLDCDLVFDNLSDFELNPANQKELDDKRIKSKNLTKTYKKNL